MSNPKTKPPRITFVGEGQDGQPVVRVSGYINSDDNFKEGDPLDHFCHAEKDRLLEEEGKCVTYTLFSMLNEAGERTTIIEFVLSNTIKTVRPDGKPDTAEFTCSSEERLYWKTLMAQRCAEAINAYLEKRYPDPSDDDDDFIGLTD